MLSKAKHLPVSTEIIDTQYVMLSKAKHLAGSTNREILRYAQNDIDNDTQYVMLSKAKHLAVSTNIRR